MVTKKSSAKTPAKAKTKSKTKPQIKSKAKPKAKTVKKVEKPKGAKSKVKAQAKNQKSTKTAIARATQSLPKAGRKNESGDPIRPATAYFHYVSARRQKVADMGIKGTDNGRKIAEEWRGMSKAQRKPFEDKAAKDHRRYSIEIGAIPV